MKSSNKSPLCNSFNKTSFCWNLCAFPASALTSLQPSAQGDDLQLLRVWMASKQQLKPKILDELMLFQQNWMSTSWKNKFKRVFGQLLCLGKNPPGVLLCKLVKMNETANTVLHPWALTWTDPAMVFDCCGPRGWQDQARRAAQRLPRSQGSSMHVAMLEKKVHVAPSRQFKHGTWGLERRQPVWLSTRPDDHLSKHWGARINPHKITGEPKGPSPQKSRPNVLVKRHPK